MSLGIPKEGFQNSQAYQTPGLPFVRTTSAATEKIEFPNVTRSIHVTADGADIAVYFAAAAPAARKFTVKNGTTVTLPVRVRDLWVDTGAGTASIFAALTTIERHAMPELDGSIWVGIE